MRREGPRVAKRVEQLVERIREPRLRDAAMQYPEAGGKLLRPALAAIACEAAGGSPERADPLAASVELLHTFSLVHDDLMDRDAERRGVPSVHEAFDEPTSILAGDALFALAFEALGDLEDPAAAIVGDVAETARTLCEGQRRDVRFEDEWPSLDDYEAMIEAKTAVLFACSTRNAARLAGAQAPAVEALSRFGRCLGLGFQVQDDLLDLVGDPETLGKPRGSDVRAGKKTHPLIEARRRLDGDERERLEAALDGGAATDEVDWVLEAVEATGAQAASRERAEAFFDEAREALDELDESPARADLAETLAWLRDRDR